MAFAAAMASASGPVSCGLAARNGASSASTSVNVAGAPASGGGGTWSGSRLPVASAASFCASCQINRAFACQRMHLVLVLVDRLLRGPLGCLRRLKRRLGLADLLGPRVRPSPPLRVRRGVT